MYDLGCIRKSGRDFVMETALAYAEKNREPTTAKNIYLAELECYISNVMARENSKVKDSFIFDISAVVTCPKCSTCSKTCYAKVAERIYKETREKRAMNTYLALYFPEKLESLINNQLENERTKRGKRFNQVRIHSSGDFFSRTYIYMWRRIAKNNPDFTFFFYTKAHYYYPATLSSFAELANVRMVSSILPDGNKNYGKEDFIQSKLAKFGSEVALCPCHNPKMERIERDGNIKIECMRECEICLKNKYVLIYEHK